jgi:rhamnosyltransferase
MNPAAHAIVVTYHPGPEVIANLAALRSQLPHVVVVDNGSNAEEMARLRRAALELELELIENGENLGIATALNIGLRRLLEAARPTELVVLFDQDSRITEGFLPAMLRALETSRWGGRLGILVPRYLDGRLNRPLPSNLVQEGLEAAMTSGSMLRLQLFAELGLFVDELFIDGVDYEFSLRLRRAGYVIEECAEALLLHAPGEPKRLKLFGILNYQTANYSPTRRYYQERNKVWTSKRYFFSFPVFCLKLAMFSTKDFFKIIFGEAEKLRKLRFFLHGIWDGITERMGPCRLD